MGDRCRVEDGRVMCCGRYRERYREIERERERERELEMYIV